jgi:putative transposase
VKKSRFSEKKIIAVLKQAEAGVKVAELVRKNGISEATFYNWKAKYGGLDVSRLRKLKELEVENARLKKMYAELSLAHHVSRLCATRFDPQSDKRWTVCPNELAVDLVQLVPAFRAAKLTHKTRGPFTVEKTAPEAVLRKCARERLKLSGW